MKIALDAFGSDNAPVSEVEGAIRAIHKDFCDKIYLVGKKKELNRNFKSTTLIKLTSKLFLPKKLLVVQKIPLKRLNGKKIPLCKKPLN